MPVENRAPKRNSLLTPLQTAILKALHGVPDAEHFYLTGGTALAEFYLGHRRSFGLDLFTPQPGLVVPFSRVAEEELRRGGLDVKTVPRLASFAEFQASWGHEEVRVQLACDTPHRFAPPIENDLGRLNDFQDLVVDKLLAFFGRAEPRDAVDLAFIFREVNPCDVIELAPVKDPGFDLHWLARALERVEDFPDEAERWPVEMVLPLHVPELKASFRKLADEIMNRLKP